MNGLHADAVHLLSRWTPTDENQLRLRAEFRQLLQDRPDGLRRECVPAHITASALVVDTDAEHVLLGLHRKVGLWLQMGGHCEETDATLAGAALREAVEECGIADLRLLPQPIDLDKHAAPCAPGIAQWHFDVRFVAVTRRSQVPVTSEESYAVQWFPVRALPAEVSADLGRLIAAARLAVTGRAPVTVRDLAAFSDSFADLDDPQIMKGAWE